MKKRKINISHYIMISLILLGSYGIINAFTIETNFSNTLLYLKRILITQDGTSNTPSQVEIEPTGIKIAGNSGLIISNSNIKYSNDNLIIQNSGTKYYFGQNNEFLSQNNNVYNIFKSRYLNDLDNINNGFIININKGTSNHGTFAFDIKYSSYDGSFNNSNINGFFSNSTINYRKKSLTGSNNIDILLNGNNIQIRLFGTGKDYGFISIKGNLGGDNIGLTSNKVFLSTF